MTEFLTLLPPAQALHEIISALPAPCQTEVVPTQHAFRRVTAEALFAPHPLPEFPRSTVDGYAVLASDTYGASDGLPVYLVLAGEAPMGEAPSFEISPGQCALIYTGAMTYHANLDAVQFFLIARQTDI